MINEYEDLDIYRIKTDQKLNKKKIDVAIVLCYSYWANGRR